MTATPAVAEFLYELWDANWDDGPLGNWKILAHPITRKTARRIYFTRGGHRAGFVDRQRIEADGEVFYRPIARTLYLASPETSTRPAKPSLPELRKAMADADQSPAGGLINLLGYRTEYGQIEGNLAEIRREAASKKCTLKTSAPPAPAAPPPAPPKRRTR